MYLVKPVLFAVLSFLLVFSAIGQLDNYSSVSRMFASSGRDQAIEPPAIPSESMEGGESALHEPVIFPSITLRDSQTGAIIGNVHVMVETTMLHDGAAAATLVYVGENGTLPLALKAGVYELVLKVDSLDSPGGDYYLRKTVSIPDIFGESIMIYPVGSIRGQVFLKDSVVRGAAVSFECSGLYGETTSVATDQYGTFALNWLPLGNCRIKASDNNIVGSAYAEITHGGLADLDIVLETKVSGAKSYYLLAFVLAGAVFLFLLKLMKSRQNVGTHDTISHDTISHDTSTNDTSTQKTNTINVPSDKISSRPIVPAESEHGFNKRLADIFATLTSREKEIVSLLHKQGELNQSRIGYSLAIPKTTLVRVLQGLENKRIVQILKMGKSKKICLTDWIIEK